MCYWSLPHAATRRGIQQGCGREQILSSAHRSLNFSYIFIKLGSRHHVNELAIAICSCYVLPLYSEWIRSPSLPALLEY